MHTWTTLLGNNGIKEKETESQLLDVKPPHCAGVPTYQGACMFCTPSPVSSSMCVQRQYSLTSLDISCFVPWCTVFHKHLWSNTSCTTHKTQHHSAAGSYWILSMLTNVMQNSDAVSQGIVLARISVSVIKHHWPKETLEGKGLFHLIACKTKQKRQGRKTR